MDKKAPLPRKAASAPMDKAERAARADAAEVKKQQANTKAYDAATGYKNGGMVKCSKTATKRSWG